VVAPLAVGVLGALFERHALRRVHKFGHVPELLITFGLSYVCWNWCNSPGAGTR
jgi:branched-chain amino acid transport system permease protein